MNTLNLRFSSKNKDYIFAALIGFGVGILVVPILVHIGVSFRIWFWALPIFTATLWTLGLILGDALVGRFSSLRQFSRFAVVGTLNTAIDFSSLNILSMTYGITAGLIVGGINVPGLSVSLVNSYLWNKLWVFKGFGANNILKDIPLYLTVSMTGLFINSSLVVLITTYIIPFGGLAPEVWLNVAKVAATAVSMFWFFFGYKFLVFPIKSDGHK